MSENRALWLPSPGGAFRVGPAPTPEPGPHEVLVRVRAVALNPTDAGSGLLRRIALPHLRYPAVLGTDVAGEIVQVGAAVTALRVGDRVTGYAAGQDRSRNRAAEGAFQLYSILSAHLCSPIPAELPYEQAAVLPLALMTASAGLFEPGQLGLALPGSPPPPSPQVVLVWGGSTSVGGNAIQLARNCGYQVIATASPRNFGYVESLGAQRVFDYRDAAVVSTIIDHLRGRHLAGTIDLGQGSLRSTVTIARRSTGTRRIASAFPAARLTPQGLLARRHAVRVSGIWGTAPLSSRVGPAIFRDFLPTALRDGHFTAAPPAKVAGQGLEAIPAALSLLKAGVSAQKIVVALG